MFFKPGKSVKPFIRFQANCEHSLSSSQMHFMDNGKILSIGNDSDRNQTIMHLFDPSSNELFITQRLDKPYHLLANFPNGTFLLRHSGYKEDTDLLLIDSNTLKTVLVINMNIKVGILSKSQLALDNTKFIKIEYSQKNNQCALLLYDVDKPNEVQTVSSPIEVDTNARYFSDVVKLANGQFAFRALGNNTTYFEVFLLDRDHETKQFKLSGVISPYQEDRDESLASGHFVGLSDGQVLTYHESGNNFQIWKGTECTKKWSWSDFQYSDPIFKKPFWTQGVFPMPDGEHILVMMLSEKLFLFNIKTNAVIPIDLGDFTPCDVKVRDNGQVLVQATQHYKNNVLLLLDFNDKVHLNCLASQEQDSESSETVGSLTIKS